MDGYYSHKYCFYIFNEEVIFSDLVKASETQKLLLITWGTCHKADLIVGGGPRP
jgi:hypothetical protein